MRISPLSRPARRSLVLASTLVAGLASAPAAPAQEVRHPFDSDRLMADLAALSHDSMQGRAAGSEGGRMAREHIVRRLEAIGVEVATDSFPVERRTETVTGVNVRATVRGTEHPDRWLVLTAHYDHLGVRDGEVYNGADDNASGTAALLALADVLADEPPRHSVLLAFLDAEEGGLHGARYLVANAPVPLERVLVNVNMDMVGHSQGELWAVGTTQYPALKPLVEAVEPAAPVFIRFGHDTDQDTGADNWVMASDHAAFHREGVPFLYFGVSDHPDYHEPTDDVETVDGTFFPAAVETIRRVVESLDRSLEGERPGS